MKTFRALLALAAVVLLGACASGPNYKEVIATFPKPAAGDGRIWFYRPGIAFGAGIQPGVLLNGARVGESVPGGFFYIDRPRGDYEVLLSTEVDRKVTFTLQPGQERYVRMTVGLGVIVYRVYPELVDEGVGRGEIVDTAYIGGQQKK